MEYVTDDDFYVPEVSDDATKSRKCEIIKPLEKSNAFRIREVEGYLSAYSASCKLLEMNRYERMYFRGQQPSREEALEESEAYLRARLFEIRAFILSLPECDEKLFLYYHYVHEESVAKCGELLRVSRATVYRIKRRALEIAASYYEEMRQGAL